MIVRNTGNDADKPAVAVVCDIFGQQTAAPWKQLNGTLQCLCRRFETRSGMLGSAPSHASWLGH
jgi:hypothetical protein